MKSIKVMFSVAFILQLLITTSQAKQVHMRGQNAKGDFISGFVELEDNGHVWGIVRDLNDRFFILEGQREGGSVEYTVHPINEATFNQKPSREDVKRILQQEYGINFRR